MNARYPHTGPLHFDSVAHRYTVDGEHVPNVTSILAPLSAYSAAIPAAVLANKAAIGQAVHHAAELFNDGRLDWSSLHEVIRPYVDAYARFREEKSFDPLLTEARVWHPMLRFAGTLDSLGWLAGEPALVDLKATIDLMPTVGPQTAAYREASIADPELSDELQEVARRARRWCLQLGSDGTYRLTPCDDPNDWRVFLSALTIHTFKAKHAKHYQH
jgi:hypothetical protein